MGLRMAGGFGDGDTVDRGGRAAVKDGHGDAGRYFPRRGGLRVHDIVGRLGVGLIWWSGFAGDEIGRSPSS